MDNIYRIHISLSDLSDKLIWSLDKKSIFSVKSAHFLSSFPAPLLTQAPSPSLVNHPPFPWNLIWSLNIPPKVKHFLWCACKETLPVNENLLIRRMSIMDLYHLCKEAKESTMHCLVTYKLVAPVWYASCLCLRTSALISTPFYELIKSWCDLNSVSKLKGLNILSTIAIFTWNIWKARNKVVFDKVEFNMLNSSSTAFRMMSDSLVRFGAFFMPDVRNDSLAWKPPMEDLVKVNFDGAFFSSSLFGRVGVMVCD